MKESRDNDMFGAAGAGLAWSIPACQFKAPPSAFSQDITNPLSQHDKRAYRENLAGYEALGETKSSSHKKWWAKSLMMRDAFQLRDNWQHSKRTHPACRRATPNRLRILQKLSVIYQRYFWATDSDDSPICVSDLFPSPHCDKTTFPVVIFGNFSVQRGRFDLLSRLGPTTSTSPPANSEENMTKKQPHILTAGTSNGSWAAFQRLIDLSGADTVIDVRSRPYSRWPHFSQSAFTTRLNYVGLPYVYLGHQLGGLMKGDERTYAEVAQTPEFRDGIAKVQEIASRCQPILICSEHDPLQCHRYLLISRVLASGGAEVAHVLRTGEIESQRETEVRLLKANGLYCEDYWTPFEEILDRAYARQERRIRRRK